MMSSGCESRHHLLIWGSRRTRGMSFAFGFASRNTPKALSMYLKSGFSSGFVQTLFISNETKLTPAFAACLIVEAAIDVSDFTNMNLLS